MTGNQSIGWVCGLLMILSTGCAAPVSTGPLVPPAPEPNANNVWLFTDGAARALLPRKKLQNDIRGEVMQEGPWLAEELEYRRQIDALQQDGKVVGVGFWWVSPFPTVYRAMSDSEMKINGRTYAIKPGESITFQCRVSRAMNPQDDGPVRVFRSEDTDAFMLCSDLKQMQRDRNGAEAPPSTPTPASTSRGGQ